MSKTQQATQTLGAFLVEKLDDVRAQGADDNFTLRCANEIGNSRIADLVEEYYARHSNMRLADFDRQFLTGSLEKDGRWFGVIIISNFSGRGGILVTIQPIH